MPSEKTAKFTLGGSLIVTAGTPASCTTANDADELVDVSFAGVAAALSMAALTGVDGVVPPPVPGTVDVATAATAAASDSQSEQY